MTDAQSPIPPRLSTASLLVIGAGVVSILWGLAGIVLYGRWELLHEPLFVASWLPRILAVPVAFIVLGLHLRRGRYFAMLAVLLIASAELLQYLASYGLGFRFSGTSGPWLLAGVLPLMALVGAILSRPIVTAIPDAPAVDRARRRAAVGLFIVAAVLALPGAGLILFMLNVMGDMTRTDQGKGLVVVAALVAGMLVAAIGFLRMGLSLRRGNSPKLLAVVLAFIIGVLLIVVSNQLTRGWFVFRWAWTLAAVAVQGLLAWVGTDVLHARRRTEEPKSYGFSPIMAQPVVPTETPHA